MSVESLYIDAFKKSVIKGPFAKERKCGVLLQNYERYGDRVCRTDFSKGLFIR